MYQVKTKMTDQSAADFIGRLSNLRRREDALKLLEIFNETTGMNPKMWGETIIGYGKYHYKYASGHEGEAMMVGFSPRKAKISLYLAVYTSEGAEMLKDLGKHTRGKSCVYINKVEDIDIEVLKTLIRLTVKDTEDHYDEIVKDI
ncbi:MAG TPA: hypothetical protein DHM90_12150 [Clostridiaceae bacterium]|nr:hypothetical protein [Clostridiaceae bacterium]